MALPVVHRSFLAHRVLRGSLLPLTRIKASHNKLLAALAFQRRLMMKFEPLFAHLLKLFIRTDKNKEEKRKSQHPEVDESKANETVKQNEIPS